MQNRTKLELDSFKSEAYERAQTDWCMLKADAYYKNYPDSILVGGLLKIGVEYIDKLFSKLFESEPVNLSRSKKELSNDYFIKLKDELIRMLDSECTSVRSHLINFFDNSTDVTKTIFARIEEYYSNKKDWIITKVDILEDEAVIFVINTAKSHEIETLSYDFIERHELRHILEKNQSEITGGLQNRCWKSVILLCGSSIEAILFDLLKKHEEMAMATSSAQKSAGKVLPLEKWKLTFLIDTACNLGLITESLKALNHSAREFRNLIHPTKEMKGNYRLEQEEAENAVIILRTLIRDLKRNNSSS